MISIPSVLGSEEIVLHRFSSARPDPQLEEVLYLAAGVALMQAGLSSTREGDDADYILAVQYSSHKDGMDLWCRLYRPRSPRDILADMTVDLPLDNTLDARVTSAVLRLLQTAGIKAVLSPQANIEGLLPAPPPATAGENTETGTIVAGTATVVPARKASQVVFDTSVSAAGLLLFGPITEFLHYGVGGVLRGGISWPRKSWRLTVGAEVSFARAFNDSGVVGGPLYLSTAGPAVQLGTGTSAPYSISVAVSGGAAMITVAAAAGSMTKTAPYADAELQAAIPVGGKVFLGANVRFLVVFADDVLIAAAAPALSVRVEL